MRRPSLRAGVLVAAAAWLLALGAPAPAQAAPPEFQVVTDTTYVVQPAERLIHVVVDGRATSYTPDTAGRRYYYNTVTVVVLPGATNFTARAAGVRSTVTIVGEDDQQVAVRLSLNRSVFYRQTGTFQLEFDLPDGAAGGDVRVGAVVAALPLWAVGTPETPGSTVSVSVPPDFQLDVNGADDPASAPRDDGGTLFSWGPLDDPLAFYPYVIADNPIVTEGTFTAFPSTVTVEDQPVRITVKAWADDPDWGQRVSDRITAGLPVLGDLIGLPYIGTSDLTVVETVPRTIGGYAGIFDTSVVEDEIEISYDANEGVTLHEAAHAWFNEHIASERWILEGFASYYAELAAIRLGVDGGQIQLTDEIRASAFPLEQWGSPGVEEGDAELYGYAASLQAARDLGARAGLDGLTAAWAGMLAGESAYQPLHAETPEIWFARDNWHYLLDLLDERTGKSYRDIFEKWVAGPGAGALLDARDAARTRYQALRATAGDWDLPRDLRRDMSAWAFDDAASVMTDAEALLEHRDAIAAEAAALGVALPDTMRDAFEAGRFGEAGTVATALDGALAAYRAAQAADDGEDPIEWLGLIGEDPAATLASAASALADGHIDAARTDANAARDTWQRAAEVGTGRALAAGGGVVLLLGGGTGLGLFVRRRRRRRHAGAAAAAAAAAASIEVGGSAGLAGDAGDVPDPLDEREDP